MLDKFNVLRNIAVATALGLTSASCTAPADPPCTEGNWHIATTAGATKLTISGEVLEFKNTVNGWKISDPVFGQGSAPEGILLQNGGGINVTVRPENGSLDILATCPSPSSR